MGEARPGSDNGQKCPERYGVMVEFQNLRFPSGLPTVRQAARPLPWVQGERSGTVGSRETSCLLCVVL